MDYFGGHWWHFCFCQSNLLTGLNCPTSSHGSILHVGIFTFAMFFGTLKANRAVQFVFMSLAILFFMLTIRELTGNPVLFGDVTFNTITGIEGIITGASAIYLAIAEVLNEAIKKSSANFPVK
jgi:succinate-acetate transporter protein